MVRLPDGGRDAPSPSPSRDCAWATDGSRASGRQHPVQDRHANRTFILLGSEAACPQPRSDQRLVATHRRFNQRTLAIAGRRLPGQSSAVGDRRQMPITLCGRSRFGAGYSGRARRDHHLDAIAVRRDCLVGGGAVIRAAGCRPGYRTVNLIKQRGDLGWIVGILIRQGLRHDHAAGGINRQMQLAPFPARLRAILRLQPLARPVDLQSSPVDHHVQRAVRHLCRPESPAT